MKIGHLARTFAAGATLYLVMAACGAAESANALHADDGTSGGTSGSGVSDSSGGTVDAFVDALNDALVNPVKDAKAGPLPPDVATVSCSTVIKYNGTDYYFAEHAYPGKTMAELALVHVLVPTPALAGYTQEQTVGAFVKDGSVAQLCVPVASGMPAFSYTFVLGQ